MEQYDLIVIGGGPGGYVAAERAGAAGMRVMLVEKAHLGGVCANVGCIPTKSLLNGSKLYRKAGQSEQFGVIGTDEKSKLPRFSLANAMAHKQEVIGTLRKGVAFLMKRSRVEVLNAEAKIAAPNEVEVSGKSYQCSNIMIATGSTPIIPPIPGADLPHVLTNEEILSIEALPKKLVIIGGGYIGLEFASFFGDIGVPVTVIEMMDEILPMMEKEFPPLLRKSMAQVDFRLKARVTRISEKAVTFVQDGTEHSIEADTVLMAVGRAPLLKGVEHIGLDIAPEGIRVDEQMRTNLPHIFAVGDVTGKILLAHAASRMGEVAVNTMQGKKDRMRYHAIPWVIYTLPEAAGCGLTEAEAKRKGYHVKTASMQMRANGRFLIEHKKEDIGICKVVVDADTNLIIGIHILGSCSASEIIHGAALIMEAELRVQDVKETIFPHPSLSEIIKDTLWQLK